MTVLKMAGLFLVFTTALSFSAKDTVPPEGRFIEPLPHSVIDKDFVRIKIEATDEGAGIKEINIFATQDIFHEYYEAVNPELWNGITFFNIGKITNAPYETVWDVRHVEDRYFGYTELYAELEDSSGNKSRIWPKNYVQFCLDRNPGLKTISAISHYRSKPIKVDGQLTEWPDSIFNILKSGSSSARFASFWNKEHLYFGINVQDMTLFAKIDTSKRNTVFKNSETGFRFLWLGDCVELCFNPQNIKSSVRRKTHKEILYSVIGITEGNNADFYDEEVCLWGKGVETAILLLGTLNKVNDQDTGYIIETAIPWNELEVVPIEDFEMGFDLFYTDYTEQGSKGIMTSLSGVKIQNNDNPSEWARIILKKQKILPYRFFVLCISIIIIFMVFFVFLYYRRKKFGKTQGKLHEFQKNWDGFKAKSQPVQLAMDFMNERFQDDIGLTEISKAASVTSNWLGSLFKKETGQTINNYLNMLRIKKALDFLQETHKTPSEISYLVGFKDPGHFFKVFKRFVGITPAKYRKRPENE